MKKCELCSVNPADLVVKQVVDGTVRELAVCKTCADQQRMQAPLSVVDFLANLAPSAQLKGGAHTKQPSCPSCHMTWADFKKSERLGCATCYTAFESDLLPVIEDMHRATEHRGDRPEQVARQITIANLKRELKAAVTKQEFETAAALRDRIQALEASPLVSEVGHG